ncbi:hypothetical protein ACLOJK_031892 [Asimina triloba]
MGWGFKDPRSKLIKKSPQTGPRLQRIIAARRSPRASDPSSRLKSIMHTNKTSGAGYMQRQRSLLGRHVGEYPGRKPEKDEVWTPLSREFAVASLSAQLSVSVGRRLASGLWPPPPPPRKLQPRVTKQEKDNGGMRGYSRSCLALATRGNTVYPVAIRTVRQVGQDAGRVA